MSKGRLSEYLGHVKQSATDACSFVDGLNKDDFSKDKRTQQAVILSLTIIGEAATKIMDGYAEFAQAHPEVPWRSIRGMRNRMAHGYFEINLDLVWDTVQIALPELLKTLPAVGNDADNESAYEGIRTGQAYTSAMFHDGKRWHVADPNKGVFMRNEPD